jgi:thymidylate synthase (FAD)
MSFPSFLLEPTVTLLSYPQFDEPEHLKVRRLNEFATPAEKLAEYAGRVCYMSQDNPAERSTRDYLDNIRKQGHGSVFEHANFSLLLEGISRSCSHELVRHRAGFAYSQVSQRYVDSGEVAFVVPPAYIGNAYILQTWKMNRSVEVIEYSKLVAVLEMKYQEEGKIEGATNRRKKAREAARSVLPNATETKIVTTANARAWRTMLELRMGLGAEPEIRRLALTIGDLFVRRFPGFFSDIEFKTDEATGEKYGTLLYHKV